MRTGRIQVEDLKGNLSMLAIVGKKKGELFVKRKIFIYSLKSILFPFKVAPIR